LPGTVKRKYPIQAIEEYPEEGRQICSTAD
jgi:hypothetical protein